MSRLAPIYAAIALFPLIAAGAALPYVAAPVPPSWLAGSRPAHPGRPLRPLPGGARVRGSAPAPARLGRLLPGLRRRSAAEPSQHLRSGPRRAKHRRHQRGGPGPRPPGHPAERDAVHPARDVRASPPQAGLPRDGRDRCGGFALHRADPADGQLGALPLRLPVLLDCRPGHEHDRRGDRSAVRPTPWAGPRAGDAVLRDGVAAGDSRPPSSGDVLQRRADRGRGLRPAGRFRTCSSMRPGVSSSSRRAFARRPCGHSRSCSSRESRPASWSRWQLAESRPANGPCSSSRPTPARGRPHRTRWWSSSGSRWCRRRCSLRRPQGSPDSSRPGHFSRFWR